MEFRWQNDMLNSGTRHTPTELLRRYLPDVPDADIVRPLPSRWFLPKDGTFHPLVRSRMMSGDDFTPQVYIARKGRRAAIFCASGFWTNGEGTDPAVWPCGRALVAALCAIALDLHSGALDLDGVLVANWGEKSTSTLIDNRPLPQIGAKINTVDFQKGDLLGKGTWTLPALPDDVAAAIPDPNNVVVPLRRT